WPGAPGLRRRPGASPARARQGRRRRLRVRRVRRRRGRRLPRRRPHRRRRIRRPRRPGPRGSGAPEASRESGRRVAQAPGRAAGLPRRLELRLREEAVVNLIIVSNRLPFAAARDESGGWKVEPGSGGLVTALRPVLRNRGGRWIGWSGATAEE